MTVITERDIVLVGGGGHALACAELIAGHETLGLGGYVAPQVSSQLESLGATYLGDDDILPDLAENNLSFHVAVGQIKSPEKRILLFSKLVLLEVRIPNLLARSATVSEDASMGYGNFVGSSVNINAGVTIGNNCIMNTGGIIEHGVTVGDHCHVAPGAIVLGEATIGAMSFVGAGAIIREGVKVAPRSIIPAGTFVTRDFGTIADE